MKIFVGWNENQFIREDSYFQISLNFSVFVVNCFLNNLCFGFLVNACSAFFKFFVQFWFIYLIIAFDDSTETTISDV